MRKHCGNCAVYDRKNLKHSELCGKCVTEHFSNGKESDPSMWKPLPQTNADRIRAMSDEELERFLGQYSLCTRVGRCPDHGECHRCVLDWLKQPVKDGEDE